MDGDTLTVGDSTDFEEYMRESVDETSEEGVAGVAMEQNLTALEALVSDAWERVRDPGLQLHEAAVLLVSGAVVALHALLGLLHLPLHLPMHLPQLLHWALALACAYSLLYLYSMLRRVSLSCVRPISGQEANANKSESEVEEESPVDNIESAQLEKEERVQRWIDNLYSDREQVNLEACGEIKGRNMEADASCADLLGDGQVAPPLPPLPPPLPPPPIPPRALPAAPQKSPKEDRRALSLAYELSVAVRKHASNDIRASLSAPTTPSFYSERLSPTNLLPLLSESGSRPPVRPAQRDRDDWKVALVAAEAPRGNRLPVVTDPLHKPQSVQQPQSLKQPLPQPQQPISKPQPLPQPSDSRTATTAAVVDPAAASSLLNFVRRFSGTRFLMREPYGELPDLLPLPGQPSSEESDEVKRGAAVRRSSSASQTREATEAPRRAAKAVSTSEASTSVTSNVMKVFSKGILSEGAVDASATSLQTEGAVGGVLSLPAQEAAALRSKTTSTDSETFFNCEHGARSSLNLSSQRSRASMDPFEDTEAPWGSSSPPTTTRGLTVNLTEDGLIGSKRAADPTEADHKSLFDLRKSLLTSIPEATPPDEDLSHL